MPNQPSDLRNFLNVVSTGNYIILDTETSGLKRPAEIVEIAMCDSIGNHIFSELVRPLNGYGTDAARITGITSEMLEGARTWREIRPEVESILQGANVVVYNATFDRMMFHCSDESNGLEAFSWSTHANWYCAMLAFAEYNGEWNDYRQSYTWKKLSEAMAYFDDTIENYHRAMFDCLATATVVMHMRDKAPKGLD
jgi:DNA polymerase-3 subunit epsilon